MPFEGDDDIVRLLDIGRLECCDLEPLANLHFEDALVCQLGEGLSDGSPADLEFGAECHLIDATSRRQAAHAEAAEDLSDDVIPQGSAIQRHLALPFKIIPVSYTHLRAHETRHDLVCRLLLEK